MVSLEDGEVDLEHRGIHGDRHSQQGHLAYMMTLEDYCYTVLPVREMRLRGQGMTSLQSGTLRPPPASVTTIEARPQKL